MKAKPAKIVFRIKSNWQPYEIERIVVIRETDNYLFLDVGNFVTRVDKRSESLMAQLFDCEQAALREADRFTREQLRDAVVWKVRDLKYFRKEVIAGERELVAARKKLRGFKPRARDGQK